jgi:p-hydroxybenzoate 3-monooxygenase
MIAGVGSVAQHDPCRTNQEVTVRTQVAIIGAGPAGSLLSHILDRNGVDTVVIERQTAEHVLGRIRAGVLERGSVDILANNGLGDRMMAERFVHEGINIAHGGDMFRVDFASLASSSVSVYGQTEIQKDLYDAAVHRSAPVIFEASDVVVENPTGLRPLVTFVVNGVEDRIECDFVVGCDGYHGVARAAIPESVLQTWERTYPFGWLGVLSETPPVDEELIYAKSERGFALCSMRNEMLSRYYVQCPLDTRLEEWPDDRFWDELSLRLPKHVAERIVTGPSIEKSVAPLRSFVAAPMRFGNLFLAGDAAHIVPPTGAKGLNLAISDVAYLSEGLIAHYNMGDDSGIDGYSDRAVGRVWKAVRFSWWMTMLLHRFDDQDAFETEMQNAEMSLLQGSRAAQAVLAENYVGLPL